MKRLMAWICISMLTFMIAVYPRSDVRAGSNDDKAKKASTLYSVKVQVKEAKKPYRGRESPQSYASH